MKTKLILLWILFCYNCAHAQQEYKLKYVFHKEGGKFCKKFQFNNSNFYRKSTDNITSTSTGTITNGVVHIDSAGKPITCSFTGNIITVLNTPRYQQLAFPSMLYRIKGSIISRGHDTLFIRMWDLYNKVKLVKARWPRKDVYELALDPTYNDTAQFIYVIGAESTPGGWKNNRFKIPFNYRMITATNLPFRITLNDGKLGADFLNFSITHLWIHGKTTFFKKQYIAPREIQFGIGPFVGLTSINSDDKLNEFGIAYGVNAAYMAFKGLNVIGAFGWENGFTNRNQNHAFVAIGLGFKLVDLYSPGIEN